MSIEEVHAAYDTAFSGYAPYFSTIVGKFVVLATVMMIVFWIFVLVGAYRTCKEYGKDREDILINLKDTCISTTIISAIYFLMVFASIYSYVNEKEKWIAIIPSYEEYVEDYINPYLLSMPEERRYDNLKIAKISKSKVYLISLDEENQSIKVENKFPVDSLKYILIKDGESSYISERVLAEDLGGIYKAGYTLQIAYITETDKEVIEEYLGSEINIVQKVVE